MKIGIYGREFDDSFIPNIQELFNTLQMFDSTVFIYEPFHGYLESRIQYSSDPIFFNSHAEIKDELDLLLSVGGDGTFLETIHIVRDSGIPILGINTGRLGFLASTNRDNIQDALQFIKDGQYRLQERSLITLDTNERLFGDENIALNELTVHKKDTSQMITIHTYLDDLYLNSYWADGLIIATPTGSTAYSLSCGGPIMVPGATDFVITPIAPHNLNVRPVVVPDSRRVKLKIEGRDADYLCTMDSRSVTIESAVELEVKKADFKINVVQVEGQNFLHTIRHKMMWGLDRRN